MIPQSLASAIGALAMRTFCWRGMCPPAFSAIVYHFTFSMSGSFQLLSKYASVGL